MSELEKFKWVKLGLLVLLATFFAGCSQSPTKLSQLEKQAFERPQSPPLATELSAQDEYEFALDLAELEINRQRYQQAESLLHKLRKAKSDDLRLYRMLAKVYEGQQKNSMALIAWLHVNKSSDRTVSDEAELARLALVQEAFDIAEPIYQAWLNSDKISTQVSGLNNLGFASMLQNDYRQAKEYFKQALRKDPLNSKASNNLALVTTLIEKQ
ncbi:lipopolysaccharide assembly protein LapB [Thiomicrorhabdus sp. Kp2]|uniref:tetratricopeptide repeat protein n=1 Tax=Thiomicrorhabdus sp. Kp2 TaxID=1123518 RepID=UPI00041EDA6F|nr:tetratricopeptide repeat protein [Thiomicrorhabdus sp. Kp2]